MNIQSILLRIEKQLLAGKNFIFVENFPLWKTIEIGGYASVSDMKEAFNKTGALDAGEISWHVKKSIFEYVDITSVRTNIDLLKVNVTDIGFFTTADHEEVKQRLCDIGCLPCTPEIVAALRMQYLDQPKGELLYPIIDPISLDHYNYQQYDIENENGKLCIRTVRGGLRREYKKNDDIIFVRPLLELS
jgi:hypothetical protein